MDQPLFGGSSKQGGALMIIASIVVVIFAIFAIAVAAAFGTIRTPQHYALAAMVIVTLVNAIYFFIYYRKDAEPSNSISLILAYSVVVAACLIVQVYVWIAPASCNGFYIISEKKCLIVPDIDLCFQPGFCLYPFGNGGSCFNCSSIVGMQKII